MKKTILGGMLLAAALSTGQLFAAAEKPNILVVWGDDIGQSNISVSPISVPTPGA